MATMNLSAQPPTEPSVGSRFLELRRNL
jgi:hypothetical protein